MKKSAIPNTPDSMPSLLGPIPVSRVEGLRDERGTEALGIWRNSDRSIRIETNQDKTQALQTFWHEWAHVVLHDTGIDLENELAERICDAFGLARARETLDATALRPKRR